MPRRSTRDEWLRDIEARQRNVVFPDTANNEGRFWRNIIQGKHRLTIVQRVGISVFVLAVLALVFASFTGNDPFWARVVDAYIQWVLAFGILGLFLLIFNFSQRPRRK